MKKNYINPYISLLIFNKEDDILTTSLNAQPTAKPSEDATNVTVKMSAIKALN